LRQCMDICNGKSGIQRPPTADRGCRRPGQICSM
jgi:hypothetical protein